MFSYIPDPATLFPGLTQAYDAWWKAFTAPPAWAATPAPEHPAPATGGCCCAPQCPCRPPPPACTPTYYYGHRVARAAHSTPPISDSYKYYRYRRCT